MMDAIFFKRGTESAFGPTYFEMVKTLWKMVNHLKTV